MEFKGTSYLSRLQEMGVWEWLGPGHRMGTGHQLFQSLPLTTPTLSCHWATWATPIPSTGPFLSSAPRGLKVPRVLGFW